MLRMQEMTLPGFKFQKFSGGVLRGILATHVAFSHCYPPLIYYLTEWSLFKKCPPPHGKILKKGPASAPNVGLLAFTWKGYIVIFESFFH
jgi:hypothetical protein